MTAQLSFTGPPQLISDLPLDDQPSTRMDQHGPATLSDSELLAVLLDVPTIDDARRIAEAARSGGNVARLTTPKQRRRYAAALELHRRLAVAEIPERVTADTEVIGRRLCLEYGMRQQEHLSAVYLDSRRRILKVETVFIGTINHAAVSTRDVARIALEQNATAVILSHNHPSGDPSPSADDLMFTRKMSESLRLLDIELADHIITSPHRFYSMSQRGQM